MTTRNQKKEIATYVLTLIDIEDTSIKTIIDTLKITDVTTLAMMTNEFIKSLSSNDIPIGDVMTVIRFKHWATAYKEANNGRLPSTLDEWKADLTEESWNDPPQAKQPAKTQVVNQVGPTDKPKEKSSYHQVKISDYPEWDGKGIKWYSFRKEFDATARMAKLGELLKVTDLEAHKLRRQDDEAYNEKVETLYAILEKKTAKGVALSKVTSATNEDGVIAWKNLKDYYDQEGDRKAYGIKCLQDLMKLKLESNTPGGFDKYLSDFETTIEHMEEAEQGLKETQKSTILLSGITDDDYTTTKDICVGLGYLEITQKLHAKAVELGKQSGPTRKDRRNNNNKTTNKGKDDHKSNKGKNNKNNRQSVPRLPKETWDKMTADQKKFYLSQRRSGQSSGNNYGKQYDQQQQATRHANNMSTDDNASEDDRTPVTNNRNASVSWEEGNIWRPASRNVNMIRTSRLIQQKANNVSGTSTRFTGMNRAYAKLTNATDKGPYEVAYIDSACDTCSIGGQAWVLDTKTERKVQIAGYDNSHTIRDNVEIGSAITAVDLPSGETVLLRVNEATLLGEHANSLLSVVQLREANVIVEDTPKRHGGRSYIRVEGYVIPLTLQGGMITMKIRTPSELELNTCEMVELTSDQEWHPESLTDDEINEHDYNSLINTDDERQSMFNKSKSTLVDWKSFMPYFLYPDEATMKNTLANTTKYGAINLRIPMRQHYRARNPILSRRRFMEPYATDTWFSTTTSYEGFNCAQIFYGIKSMVTSHYGMKKESQGPEMLLDFFRQEGVPLSITRDNSKMQSGKLWTEYSRRYWVKDNFIEPYHSHQNPAERAMSIHKEKINRLMIDTGAPPEAWFRAACHVADVHNHTAQPTKGYRTPIELRDGETPDISGLCQHKFWDLVYYQDPTAEFPTQGANEKLGHWLGRALSYGDQMCYYILTSDTNEIIVRSMVRAIDGERPNRGLTEDAQAESESTPPGQGSCPIINDNDPKRPKKEEFPRAPNIRRKEALIVDPDDLIDLYIKETITGRRGGKREVTGQIQEKIDDDSFRVEFSDGKQKIYDYNELINLINKDDEDGVERWTFDTILGHRWSKDKNRKGKVDVQIKWDGYEEPTWEPMEILKKEDPITLAKYAEENNLLEQSIWKWAKRYVKNKKKFNRMLRQMMAAKRRANGPKYQFGVRVPRNIKEAYELDKLNNDTKWSDAIQKEISQLTEEYECFQLAEGNVPPADHQQIPLLWTFAVKFDGRRRARLVAGGHVTPESEFDLYAGVVDLETVRIAFVAAALMQLKVIAADVGSAYIQAFTREKIYVIAGPEFGKLAGKILIIVKALYGLKTSGARWHQQFADNLRSMGFRPCKADHDLWIRDRGDYYEYVAVIVDDLLIFSKTPEDVIEPIKQVCGYELKGVGIPEYYNGADVGFDNESQCWSLSAHTYVKNITEKLEKLLEVHLKNYNSPMETGDHPELDESDLLYGGDITLYQMMIGCAQWAVTLGRFDIQYATNTLARFSSMPRKGHYDRALRLFGYLKNNTKTRILFDPSNPNHDGIIFQQKEQEWIDLYPDAQEALPSDAPPPKSDQALRLTAYVDASHATDLTNRRSVTGYLIVLGQTPIKWYSKRQNTVETSTYGSELVAMRIVVEAIMEIRYKLRMMGLAVEKASTIFGDNQAIITNMQFPTSSIKKKHNAVAYHKIREAVAAGFVRIGHVRGNANIADILTKPLGGSEYYKYLCPVLYRHRTVHKSRGVVK